MIVLDTTVLVYAVGEEHSLREPCRRLLVAHGDGRLDAATTLEVVQEFAYVRARRRGRAEAVALARSFLAALPVLTVATEHVEHGLDLFERHTGLGAFDAILAATAISHGVDALVSADRAFAAVEGLRWLDPAGSDIEDLLAG